MRKITAYTFPIRFQGQRGSLQVRIPPDVVKLTGIGLSVTPGLQASLIKTKPYPSTEAGLLSIQWQEKGDVFFQTSVPYPVTFNQDNRLFKTGSFSLGEGPNFWQSGVKHSPLSVTVPGENLILYLHYEDVFNQIQGVDDLYHVHLELIGEPA